MPSLYEVLRLRIGFSQPARAVIARLKLLSITVEAYSIPRQPLQRRRYGTSIGMYDSPLIRAHTGDRYAGG